MAIPVTKARICSGYPTAVERDDGNLRSGRLLMQPGSSWSHLRQSDLTAIDEVP
jgi:hypothetical protein